MKSIKESLEAEKEQKVKLEKVNWKKIDQMKTCELAWWFSLAWQSAPFLNEYFFLIGTRTQVTFRKEASICRRGKTQIGMSPKKHRTWAQGNSNKSRAIT